MKTIDELIAAAQDAAAGAAASFNGQQNPWDAVVGLSLLALVMELRERAQWQDTNQYPLKDSQ